MLKNVQYDSISCKEVLAQNIQKDFALYKEHEKEKEGFIMRTIALDANVYAGRKERVSLMERVSGLFQESRNLKKSKISDLPCKNCSSMCNGYCHVLPEYECSSLLNR